MAGVLRAHVRHISFGNSFTRHTRFLQKPQRRRAEIEFPNMSLGTLAVATHTHLSGGGRDRLIKSVKKNQTTDRIFYPKIPKEERDLKVKMWKRAAACSFGWSKED